MVLLPFILYLPTIKATSLSTSPTDIQLGHNILGAILFFSYIFAALYFSSYIVLSIYKSAALEPAPLKSGDKENSRQSQKSLKRTGWVWHHGAFATFCALSLTSFAVLSWNMLNFLIVSYLGWSAKYGVSITSGLRGLVQFKQHVRYVWLWATGSDLFQTFAEDLISDPVQWKLVRAALVYSYTWNSWMSTLGHEADIPILWAYFVLDQILPVSFTQNLFCAALVQASPTSSHNSKAELIWQTGLFLRLAGLICYCAALYWIPTTTGTVWFFPTLFALRILLFTPYLVDRLTFQQQRPALSRPWVTTTSFNYCLVALSIVATGSISMSKARASRSISTTSLDTNYAAAALSNDAVLGYISGLAILFLARR